jgi:Zn-dependent metalloprotease
MLMQKKTCGYINGFWNGETVELCEDTGTDDMLGHEWGHAYMQYRGNLVYAFESGALAEVSCLSRSRSPYLRPNKL